MGIEDILSKLGGQDGQAGGLASIMKLFGGHNNPNGLQGVASQLKDNGMGEQLKSWVGEGQNQPVTGDQIRQAADPAMLNQLAEQAHMSPEEASNKVAQVLPEMVNQATPEGHIPSGNPFSQGMDKLKGMMGSR